MLEGIDINQVKQYNASLKQYRDKAANINAQIAFSKNEIDTLCKELSAELGVEVNEANIEKIYKEQVEKINSTLKSGNTILAKIAEEEKKIELGQATTQAAPVQETPVQQTTQQQATAPVPPMAPIPPMTQQATTAQPEQIGGAAPGIPGSVFGQGPMLGGQGMFHLGG